MKIKILSFSMLLFCMVSCNLLFNSFSQQKFKGTYKIELKELFSSVEGLNSFDRFLAGIAKFAMSDLQVQMTFGDNKKGSFKIEGAAIDMLSVISEDLVKAKEFEYYFKSDSILMIKLDTESNAFQKFGVVRAYEKDYSAVTFYMSDNSEGSKSTLLTMKRM